MFKQVLILSIGAWLLALSAIQVESVELIELNDANRNELPLEVSKALETVQSALNAEFKFNAVGEAMKFVEKCKDLSESVSQLKDTDYNGLAGKIKSLLQAPELVELCKIKLSKFANFELLNGLKEDAYLSRKTLESVVALGKNLDEHPKIKKVLGHLFEVVSTGMGKKMLINAAYDTSIYFGEEKVSGFMEYDYLAACEISLVKPICQLIRRTSSEDVTAIGADVADFNDALKSGKQDVVSRHEQASGFTIGELKESCSKIQKYLYPMQQVTRYLQANFVTQQQVDEQSELDKNFGFYYQLERLCQTQAGLSS